MEKSVMVASSAHHYEDLLMEERERQVPQASSRAAVLLFLKLSTWQEKSVTVSACGSVRDASIGVSGPMEWGTVILK